MTFTSKIQPVRRRARGRSVRPTKTELDGYYELLRKNAARGDVQAAAALISLAEGKALLEAPLP